MSFYELDRPAAPGLLDRAGGFLASLRAGGRSLLRSLAYARMIRALHEMDDDALARIGIARHEIPAHAERCLAADRSFKG